MDFVSRLTDSLIINHSEFVVISVLCGASFLHIHDEDDPDVHPDPEEVRSQERNPYIKMIQEAGGWSCQGILQLTCVIQRLYTLFDFDEAVPHLVEECVTVSDTSESRDRSLVQEFVNHDKSCFLKRESPEEARFNPVVSLQEFSEMMEMENLELSFTKYLNNIMIPPLGQPFVYLPILTSPSYLITLERREEDRQRLVRRRVTSDLG